MVAREVDALVSRLLTETRIPFQSLGQRVLSHFADLKKILSANYLAAAGLPARPLLRELSLIANNELRPYVTDWKSLDDSPEMLSHMSRIFGPREIELRTEPYRRGAGLALRGFFCRANLKSGDKFVIFLNTAHHPGAVAATLGHELGHFIHGSLVGETQTTVALMEGNLSAHIDAPDELFADSLVALAAYPAELMRTIGLVGNTRPGTGDDIFERIKLAYDLIGRRFKLDLKHDKISPVWRVRYLASMTHFFKLRSALYQLYEL
ncbi:MAG TPA: hypothetical protein VMA09_05490 [Candidatus Binataceae bacterium]|nr:hypothetical protein [Candidatus Binataceae bacterium]